MTQTQTHNTSNQQPANHNLTRYVIDPAKLNKALPKLLNGEAYKLRSMLPRLLSSGGILDSQVSREKYDYREQLLKRKEPDKHAMLLNNLVSSLETMRDDKYLVERRLAEFKLAMDECFKKYNIKSI